MFNINITCCIQRQRTSRRKPYEYTYYSLLTTVSAKPSKYDIGCHSTHKTCILAHFVWIVSHSINMAVEDISRDVRSSLDVIGCLRISLRNILDFRCCIAFRSLSLLCYFGKLPLSFRGRKYLTTAEHNVPSFWQYRLYLNS